MTSQLISHSAYLKLRRYTQFHNIEKYSVSLLCGVWRLSGHPDKDIYYYLSASFDMAAVSSPEIKLTVSTSRRKIIEQFLGGQKQQSVQETGSLAHFHQVKYFYTKSQYKNKLNSAFQVSLISLWLHEREHFPGQLFITRSTENIC